MGKVFCDQIRVLEWSKDSQTSLDDSVLVYRASLESNIEKIDSMIQLLSEDEVDRSRRYKRKVDRDRFIIGRIMVKRVASSILNKDLASLEIIYSKNNKPIIDKENSFQFNLSHSGNYVVLAICKKWETGIDLEYCNSEFKYESVLDHCMSKNERTQILNDKNPQSKFLLFWTRKESVLKATGVGIMDTLNMFSCLDGFNLIPDVLTGIASQWMIRSFYIDKDYIVSLAHDSNIQKLKFFDFKF